MTESLATTQSNHRRRSPTRFLRRRRPAGDRRHTDGGQDRDLPTSSHGDAYAMKVVTQDWHLDPGDHWSTDPNFADHVAGALCRGHQRRGDTFGTRRTALGRGHSQGSARGCLLRIRRRERRAARRWSTSSPSAGIIVDVTVVGFATDHCVKATATRRPRHLDFDVDVLLDLCAGVDSGDDAVGNRRDD